MPNFTTRVELHDAKSEDYDKLHEAMEAKGFSRTIKGQKGELTICRRQSTTSRER